MESKFCINTLVFNRYLYNLYMALQLSLQVFRPYAKHWLGPLLQLAVCENIGEGIHYMIVEIVATILSWTGLATPTVRNTFLME